VFNMIKRAIFCIFIALAVVFSGFSETITVTGEAPVFGQMSGGGGINFVDLNSEMDSLFDKMVEGIQEKVDEFFPDGLNTDGLLEGFGKASVFGSHGGTMFGYSEFKSFSISVGAMAGLQLPKGSANLLFNGLRSGNILGAFDDLLDNIKGGGTIGVVPQILNLNIGFKPSALFKSLPKSLSMGLRVGYFGWNNLAIPIESMPLNIDKYSALTLGVTANLQLIPTFSLAGLLKWRGINIGAGFIWQTTKLDLSLPFTMDPQDIGSTDLQAKFNPKANLNFNIETFTVPVEISTAITLLIINIPIGVGFDFGFGKSGLSANMHSDVDIVDINGNISNYVEQTKPGSLNIGIGGNLDLKVFNWKIMTGVGITFGDYFIIDVPITYYFDDGFNVGVTLAVRF